LRIVRRLFVWFGIMAGKGAPITWDTIHRKHRQSSNREGDPHSPRSGAWWSHILWLFPCPRDVQWNKVLEPYAPGLLKDPFKHFLNRRPVYFLAPWGGSRVAFCQLASLGPFYGRVAAGLRDVHPSGLGPACDLAGQLSLAPARVQERGFRLPPEATDGWPPRSPDADPPTGRPKLPGEPGRLWPGIAGQSTVRRLRSIPAIAEGLPAIPRC